MYNESVTKVSVIDTSGLVLKYQYDTDKSGLEKKILDAIGLVKKEIIILVLLA